MLRNLGRAGVTTDETADCNRWINQTIRNRICTRHNWSGMEVTFDTSITIVDGTDNYAWPTPTRHKDTLWIEMREDSSSEWKRLKEEDQDVLFDASNYSNLTEGFPTAWARVGDKFYLRGIPDAAYLIRIKQVLFPADLSSNSDTNFVTLYWSDALEAGATAKGFLYYADAEMAAQWDAKFEQLLQEAIVIDRQNQTATPRVLRPSLRAGRKESGKKGFSQSRFWGSSLYDWYS